MLLNHKSLTGVFPWVVLGTTYFFSSSVLAEPTINSSLLNQEQANLNIINTTDLDRLNPEFTPFESLTNSFEASFNSDIFINETNLPTLNNPETIVKESCACAADLQEKNGDSSSLEIQGIEQFYQAQENHLENSSQTDVDLPVDSSQAPQINNNDSERWHFKLQPYVTVPVSTYGTATVKGRTVSYHLDLGELLESLKLTASGRFEAWKGRWGFIVDGYFVNLQGVGSFDRSATRIPNTINVLNYLLSKNTNSKIQEIADNLNKKVDRLEQIEELRNSEEVQILKAKVDNLRETVAEDREKLQELQENINNIRNNISNVRDNVQDNIDNIRNNINNVRDNVNNIRDNINNVRDNVNNIRDNINNVQDNIGNLQDNVDNVRDNIGNVEDNIGNIRDNIDNISNLPHNVDNISTEISQAQQRINEADYQFRQVELLGLNEQETKKTIIINYLDSSRLADGERLDEKIQKVLAGIEKLEAIQQKLIETRETLERTLNKIQQLRVEKAEKESEILQKIETEIENAKDLLTRDIEALKQLKDFQENRLPQQINTNLTTDLQFTQGIYDFAISYHIGPPPMYELPETPSNRSYPLVWFQPIAGVRLNDININIDQTIDVEISSSLLNIQTTFQENFSGGRTWFEPMLGGKLGIQLSDPIILWVRGDVSGFGLAGETNLSWNIFFGVDWWVRRNISLQLAYRFYEIDYKNGSGNNAFGFSENFNGPYLSATFHF